MARDIVLDPKLLSSLHEIADGMRGKHIILATSKTFEKIYSLELSCPEKVFKYGKFISEKER
jgi:uncharacterized 2Fe-2S/4Fe-4S cluster protein (DUF4445 family)